MFIFASGINSDTVTDFEIGTDLLDFLSYEGVSGLDDLRLSNSNGDALIRAPQGGRIFLEGVDVLDLSESDFIFIA